MQNGTISGNDIYTDIIVKKRPILDFRSEGEFEKAALPNSVNIPIMTNEIRHLVGIEYKKNGNEAALALGHSLVSGKDREILTDKWAEFLEHNPDSVLTCSRGGQRSEIAQNWIFERTGKLFPRLKGGYKDFRTFLISSLLPENINVPSLIISGNTGSGKTVLIKRLSNSIDLEQIANHRGSAFGSRIYPQPSQASFENELAFRVVEILDKKPKFIAFESESKGIGKVSIPNEFFEYMHSGPYVFVSSSMEERVNFTFEDYVKNDLKEYETLFKKGLAYEKWSSALRDKLLKLNRKLGPDRMKYCLDLFDNAIISANLEGHKTWIDYLLRNYYDPMYEHHREKWCEKVIKYGSIDEIYDFLATGTYPE